MCWISHFGPNGHEKRVISLIRVIVCHGSGRTFSTMGFCGVEVMASTRTLQMLGPVLLGYWWSKCHSVCENHHSWFFLFWVATWFGYQVPSVSYLQPWRIWQQNHKNKLRTPTLFQFVNQIYYIRHFLLEICYVYNIFTTFSQQIISGKLLLVIIWIYNLNYFFAHI